MLIEGSEVWGLASSERSEATSCTSPHVFTLQVKANPVQHLIWTGRTGHWLNHTCPHLLTHIQTSPHSVQVKTNQLQQLIRTGRTGHWLNHSKEHCLVGYKGAATALNRRVDCDVLVADVRGRGWGETGIGR